MTWIEFLIIYLACGSPLAVYQAMRDEELSLRDLPRSLALFLIWPGLAVKLLIDRFRTPRDLNVSLEDEIKQARAAMEKIAFPPRGASNRLQDFRDVFDRYAGLTLGIRDHAAGSRELFEISGHSKPDVAARVLARRNREKLLLHQTQARNEFVDLIAEVSLEDGRVIPLALHIADKLGDVDAVAELDAMIAPMRSGPVPPATSPATVR